MARGERCTDTDQTTEEQHTRIHGPLGRLAAGATAFALTAGLVSGCVAASTAKRSVTGGQVLSSITEGKPVPAKLDCLRGRSPQRVIIDGTTQYPNSTWTGHITLEYKRNNEIIPGDFWIGGRYKIHQRGATVPRTSLRIPTPA